MKSKLFMGIGFIVALLSTFLFTSTKVFADPDEDVLLPLYEKFESILHIDDGFMIQKTIRWIGWGLIKTLSWMNNFLEGAVTKIVGVNGFYQAPAMQKIMDVIVPLAFGLFVVSLFFLGIQFMLNKIEKREEILLNVTMAVAVIVIIPVLVTQMHNLLGFGVGYTSQLSPNLSGAIVQSNVADLQYYVEKDFRVSGSKRGTKNRPPLPQSKSNSSVGTSDYTYANQLGADKSALGIDITETIDVDESLLGGAKDKWAKEIQDKNETAYEFLKHKAMHTGKGDELGVVNLQKNVIPATDIGKERYYRYHVNWGVTIFTLLVTTFALAITLVKVGRMMFDIVFTQFFAMFVAVTDLTGGQRTKKVLTELASSFGVLFIMVFIMQLFIYYANWVNGLKSDIGTIPVVLMLIAGAWALMDAPDVVQRMMGIDAGLRSGYGAMMGAFAGASLAGKGIGMVKGAVSTGARMATGAMATTAGVAKGAWNGMRNGGKTGDSQPKMPNSGGKPPSGGGGGNPPNIPPNNGGGGGISQNDGSGALPVMNSNQKKADSSQKKSSGAGSQPKKTDGIPNSEKGGAFATQGSHGDGGTQMPTGWSETNSGIAIPSDSGGSDIDEGGLIPLDGGSPNSVNDEPIPSGSIHSVQPQTQMQGTENLAEVLSTGSKEIKQGLQQNQGSEGIVSGSKIGQSIASTFGRGYSTGFALGSFARGTASSLATRGRAYSSFGKGKVRRVGNTAKMVGGGAVKSVAQSPTVTYARGTASSIGETVKSVGAGAVKSVAQSPTATFAKATASSIGQTVKSIGAGAVQSVAQSPTATFARGTASSVGQTIRNVGGSAVRTITQNPTVTAGNIGQTVRSVGAGAVKSVAQSPTVTYARGTVSSVGQAVRSVGASVGQSVAQSPTVTYTKATASNVGQTIRNVGGSAVRTITQSPTVTYTKATASSIGQTVKSVGGSAVRTITQSPTVTYTKGSVKNVIEKSNVKVKENVKELVTIKEVKKDKSPSSNRKNDK